MMDVFVPRGWSLTRGAVCTPSSVRVSMETRCYQPGLSYQKTATNGEFQLAAQAGVNLNFEKLLFGDFLDCKPGIKTLAFLCACFETLCHYSS